MTPINKPLRVLSRQSNLALKQVEEVFGFFPNIAYTLETIPSFGDKNLDISLLEQPPADIFTRELDEAVIYGKADIAIHSAKDLPYPLPAELEVYALLKASETSDALVSANNLTLSYLPRGAWIGTSSPVRKKELLQIRPDLKIISVRGTIEQRIAKVDQGELDALVVATCALNRLGLANRIAEILPFQTHPLQGYLAVIGKRDNSKFKLLFKQKDVRTSYGHATLVGFGPGNPEFLTIAGEKALKQAEIIFYDDLLDHTYLEKYNATKINVGKRKDFHRYEQAEINKLLLDAVRDGKKVVRLKGGDPMVFAHGGEEVEYLKQHLTTVSVIPGISTAMAASALTQIPLTHRGISSSVSFITGHSESLKFPKTDTVVVYMGANKLKQIAQKAIDSSWKSETPVMLVSNVSSQNQQETYTTLLDLTSKDNHFQTPLIAIFGNVVSLRNLSSERLQNPNILVTGTTTKPYRGLGNILHQPLIQIKPLEDYEPARKRLQNLNEFDWLIFTSRHTVNYFFDVLSSIDKDSRSLGNLKIASIGKTTTKALSKFGICPDFQAGQESSKGILRDIDIKNISKATVLIPRSDLALSVLPDGLSERGWTVQTLVLYTNSFPDRIVPIKLDNVDKFVFSSPSCVTNFKQLYGFLPHPDRVILRGTETSFRYYILLRNRQSTSKLHDETI